MRIVFARAILLLFLSISSLSTPSFSQESLRIAGQESENATEGIALTPGRPDYLQTMKFFENPSSFSYAVFVDPSRDTILFVLRDARSALPQCWLLGVQSDQVVGTKELAFDTSHAGLLLTEGEFLWSDRSSSSFEIRYIPAEQRVWCGWGEGDVAGFPRRTSIFSFGIRFESSMIFGSNLDYSRHHVLTVPLSFSLVPTFRLLPGLALETRIGVLLSSFSESFGGAEVGAFLRGAPLGNEFYLIGGITAHFIANYDQGMSYHVVVNGGEYTFLCLGAGMQFSPSVLVDLMIFFPQDRTFGHVDLIEGSTWLTPAYMKKVDGILKLGVCFYP